MNAMTTCGCGAFQFPTPTCNLSGLPSISYRVGDYTSFRYELLEPLPGETELTAWRPGASGDLAMQMVEWWAYLADILTFYNERIANEAYLGTALLPESVNHIVQLLGYRPKPALGSKGTLAALLTPSARLPLTVPARLQIQSKPGPGQQPQVFEVDQPTTIGAPDMVIADVQPLPANLPLLDPTIPPDSTTNTIWLAGKVTSIKPGDRLLLIKAQAITSQTLADFGWINVTSTTPGTDPLGNSVTQLAFSWISGDIVGTVSGVPSDAQAKDYVLLKSQQSAPLWPYTPDKVTALTTTTADLAQVTRGLGAGALFLIDVADSALSMANNVFPTAAIVSSYAEVVWYANGVGLSPPGQSSPPVTPIAIPHTEITFAPPLISSWPSPVAYVTIRWSWLPVGQIVPVTQTSSYNYTAGATLIADPASLNPMPLEATPVPVLIEDAAGDAAATTLTSSGTPVAASLGTLAPPPANGFASPIDVFFNLVGVSRGKTVATETLGGGNPMVAGQDFTLAQSPVTYFFDPASVSGPNFSSTVRVSVNGVAWQEVQSFYGQPPNAQVFVLHEDDQGATHVVFGDGVNGSLLPTGTNNVVAAYRYGGGADAPDPETLTVVLTPTPGLKGVRNPLPPTGGGDPDQPSQLRSLAPQSVLTFNRAVSLDDYVAIALTASGVTQAAANYGFDPASQRPSVVLWIAGDDNAATAAAASLAGTEMPGQRLIIETAVGVTSILSLTYLRDPRYADTAVQAGLMAALTDPDAGLFAPANVGIGEPIYQSQIAAACLAVPGVVAIQDVGLTADQDQAESDRAFRFGIRHFIPITKLGCSGQVYNPGAGAYFIVPNDTTHVVLTGAVAS